MAADKYSVLGWFVAVRKDNKPDGEVLGYNFNIPQGFGKSPVPFTINLDAAFRPLTQADAERCMWVRTYWSAIDPNSQAFLTARWLKATAFRVSVRTKVKVKGGHEFVTAGYTLAESFVKIARTSDIMFVIPSADPITPVPEAKTETTNTPTTDAAATENQPETNNTETPTEGTLKIIERPEPVAV